MKLAYFKRSFLCTLFLLILPFFLIRCDKGLEKIHDFTNVDDKLEKIKYAGFRSSWYGIKYDFTNEQWETMSDNITGFFPAGNPQPTHVWIVGALSIPGICELEFEQPDAKTYEHISFNPNKNLDHEKILTHFDNAGIKVYLQVEPGLADIDTLIDLVLTQYKHHQSVIGFGVDVEWYQTESSTNTTIRVTDNLAEKWEQKVKSHNGNYTLFLKHWETHMLPATYRGEIVFIDDSQEFESLSQMTAEFKYWAQCFSPNPVMYQVGYSNDYEWWKDEPNPPKKIGEEIALNIENQDQEVGIVWVDFTLHPDKYPELNELFDSTEKK